MITLASNQRWTSGAPTINLSFAYEKVRSGADMRYRVQVTVSSVTGGSYFGYPIYLTVNIAGTERVSKYALKEAYPSQWSSDITYTSDWFTVSNKTTGATTVIFNVFSGLGSSRDQSYSYSMGIDPAASAISANNGTLGTSQNLTVTRYSSDFTHTITYKCGSETGTIATKSSALSIPFAPPLSLAAQNTSGPAVSITFTITTYNGNSVVGSPTTKTITCSIPSSVKPTCSITVKDAMGYFDTYGGYIKGLSAFEIVIEAAGAYGSKISSYKTVADGSTYPYDNFITDVIKTAGTLAINCTVTDTRGRTGSDTENVTVFNYTAPSISGLTAIRCNSDGTVNEQGEYIKITFNSAVTSLSGANTASYVLRYKKATDTSYTYVELPAYDNNFAVSSGTHIFAADSGSSYDIQLDLSDDFNTTSSNTSAPTGFAIMHWKTDGTAVGIGKIAEKSYCLDMGVPIQMNDHRIEGIGAPTSSGDAVPLGFAEGAFAPYGLVVGYYDFASIDEVDAKILELTQAMPTRSVLHFVWSGTSASAISSGVPYNGNYWIVKIYKLHVSNYAVVEMETYGSTYGYKVRNIMSDGVLGGWEWFDPPLAVGVEYRTTERWQAKPVYVRTIDLGQMPTAGAKQIAHGITMTRPIRAQGLTSIPSVFPYKIWMSDTMAEEAWLTFSKSSIYVSTNSTAFAPHTAMATVWYIKD